MRLKQVPQGRGFRRINIRLLEKIKMKKKILAALLIFTISARLGLSARLV